MEKEKAFIPPDLMQSEFTRILVKYGFDESRARKCAAIFTTNSLEGVISHGVNRFPRFIEYVVRGFVKPDAEPSLLHNAGSVEQWDGNLGPGPLNAEFATGRAMELAFQNGIGLVTLANTNHWMRGGTYGWLAARKGFIFIGWTNTEANMPAWGAKECRLGNNPLVMAVPFGSEAVVLDFAMTQYSYGRMEAASLGKKQLPYPGGYDTDGNLTLDPDEILMTRRTLPAGYWKGSGLSLLLDILAVSLSGGLSVHEVTDLGAERSLSQVFIAMFPAMLPSSGTMENAVQNILNDLKASVKIEEGNDIRIPGESALRLRKEYLNSGIPVNRDVWDKIMKL